MAGLPPVFWLGFNNSLLTSTHLCSQREPLNGTQREEESGGSSSNVEMNAFDISTGCRGFAGGSKEDSQEQDKMGNSGFGLT